MIGKVLLISGLIALCAAATIFTEEEPTTDDGTAKGCLYEDQIWGSEDGTKFYFCDDSTVIEQSCSENTFFVRNDTTCGCVPLDLVKPSCVTLTEPGPCTGNNLRQPQPAANPSQFYLCTDLDAKPLLLDCAEGRAFTKQDHYLGCFAWEQWRTLRNCTL